MVEDRTRYEEALSSGHTFCWDQRWSEAVIAFEEAIEARGNEPAAHAGLGMAYYELGKLKKALESYKLAARYSRGDLVYLKHVAEVQEQLGLLQEAGQTYMALGEIQLRRKKLDEAVVNWLRAVSFDPELLGAHQRLVAIYKRQGLVSNAVREYLIMAELYNQRSETDLALKACRLALELDPRNAEVMTAMELIQKGEHLKLSPSPEERFGQYTLSESTTEAKPRNYVPIEHGLLGTAQRFARQQLARDILSDADDHSIDGWEGAKDFSLKSATTVSQALDFQTRGRYEQAMLSFEQAIAAGLDSSAAHFCLGLLYQTENKSREAIRELEKASDDLDFRPASYYAIGQVLREGGDSGQAVEFLVEALKYLDLSTVDEKNKERIAEQYRFLAESFKSGKEPVSQARFIHGLVSFLEGDDWKQKLSEARKRLNSISADGQSLSIGDIFAAGSLQVLQSLYLSQEYSQQGKYDSAVEEAYRAIQYSPFYLAGHIQLAELMVKQDRLQIAVSKYLTIGHTSLVRGDVTGAVQNYERAVELAPLDISNRSRLIKILVEHRQIDRALEHYYNMGEVYYNLAELDKARDTYIQALRLAPKGSGHRSWRLRLLRTIADIDMQRLDWKRALSAYSELYEAIPDDKNVVLQVIDLNFKVGNPKEALQRLDKFLGSLVRQGRAAEVSGILKNIVNQWPNNEGLTNRLSRLYIHQGKHQEAIKLLDSMGEAQLNSGQTRKAIMTIERILQLNPPNSTSYLKLLERLEQEHV